MSKNGSQVATQITDTAQWLCDFDDLYDGQSRGFDPDGKGRDTIFIVRRGQKVFAWRNACPHYDRARMAWKKDEFLNADRSAIVCGAHGALFDIENGECFRGPALGKKLKKVDIERRGHEIYLINWGDA